MISIYNIVNILHCMQSICIYVVVRTNLLKCMHCIVLYSAPCTRYHMILAVNIHNYNASVPLDDDDCSGPAQVKGFLMLL